MRCGDLVAGRPGDVAVEDGDVVGVDAQQLQRRVAVAGDVGGDRLQAQAVADGLGHVGLVLDDQHAHACSMLRAGHVVGVSKTAYGPATPRCVDWAACPTATARTTPSDAQDRPPACWSSSRPSPSPSAPRGWCPRRRRPRHPSSRLRPRPARRSSSSTTLPVAGPSARHRGAPGEATASFAPRPAVCWARRTVPSPTGTTVFDDDVPAVANSIPRCSVPCAGPRRRRRGRWRRVRRRQRLALPGVPGAAAPRRRSRSTARRRKRPAGSPPRPRRRTSRGTPSTSGPERRRHGSSEHGADYGLCQIYDNEPWHYELRPEAVDQGARAMYADPTHDPRMQP